MSNPYDYIDPSQCCSAKSLLDAADHNNLVHSMERKERLEDIQSAVASVKSQQQQHLRYSMVSKEAEQLLTEILVHEIDGGYWSNRFSELSYKEDTIL